MICISITHKNLTAAKRECFACNDEEQERLADTVAKAYPESGLILLMTCNRSEIYMSGTDTDFVWLEQQFADTKKFPVEALKGAAMRYEGRSCLTHLCRVVCGLDSAVLPAGQAGVSCSENAWADRCGDKYGIPGGTAACQGSG